MAVNRVDYAGDTLIDISDSTVTPEGLEEGAVAYSANGERITGTFSPMAILKAVYPVGAIYMSTTETDPNVLFGFGTWEQIKDTFLLACGDGYGNGSTGGSKKHQHKYGIQFGAYYNALAIEKNDNAGSLTYDENGNITGVGLQSTEFASFNAFVNGSVTQEQTSYNMYHYRSIGTTSPTSNLPPYLAVYVWKRTA